jgi:hypothetical protein
MHTSLGTASNHGVKQEVASCLEWSTCTATRPTPPPPTATLTCHFCKLCVRRDIAIDKSHWIMKGMCLHASKSL